MIGKSEGINQSFENFNIKHALKLLENQMKRLDQSSALGMWDFAAYVLSEDPNVANNVAHSYLALTQGEESYNSQSSINLWKGNISDEEEITKEIVSYVRELRHPLFGLNSEKTNEDESLNAYPLLVTATTALSGKELAYSLNFPQKSIAGLPVIECAEFGRNVVTYDEKELNEKKFKIGKIYHMNHIEKNDVTLSTNSLTSHMFINGSTGSGKSYTVYKILDSLKKQDVKFLVIEPAKGEYKNVFASSEDISVYGTNPKLMPLLIINPFSFPDNIHVLEHMDRLVELFNICWPMYAAMPAVLKDAIEKSYKECGWDLLNSTNKYKEKLYPTFDDVTRNIKSIIDESDFDSDNKGAYKGSLLVRLKSLCTGLNKLIFSPNEIKLEELFDKNTIVDLSRVGSNETKSLIMGMLVMKLQEYRMNSNVMNSELKHVTILEEAHNLLKRTSTEQSSESSNLLGKSVEMLSNAIAEMRTYGEGFVIADQAPGLLDMSVIRNTNTKIIMRLPDQSDRELVGRAANLNDDQIRELAKLPCGVGAIYQNEWVQPVLCKIDKYNNNIVNYEYEYKNNPIVDDEIIIIDKLLDCIMDKELFGKNDKMYCYQIKQLVMSSNLNSKVKSELLEYLQSSSEEDRRKLSSLLYDLLNSEIVIKEANALEWSNYLINNLEPSLKRYTKEQQDLALALIIHEKALRDVKYLDIYRSFTELKMKGDIV